jgi:hypothetical protein
MGKLMFAYYNWDDDKNKMDQFWNSLYNPQDEANMDDT